MSYTNLDPKSIDEKNGKTKEVIKSKVVCPQHIFEYVPNPKTVYNSEYLCECEE